MLALVRLARRPLDRFFRIEAASGIVLLLAAGVALTWANSPWAPAYHALWHAKLGFHVGTFAFENTLEWFVNDVLMAIFFFVVGMEIRRELHDGELSEWRRAALPVIAALGGMIVPALLYLGVAGEGAAHAGWGVPMATDIAFAVGVLALLGKRVPSSLRVLLLALAVIDDLGAILVIAGFYSAGISGSGLVVAGGGVLAIWALRAMGVRKFLAYVLPAVVVWLGVYSAGIHPTIAGVLVGLLTPVRAWFGPEGFRLQLTRASREAVSPAEFLVEELHPWVAFLIMPLFALANAGVPLQVASSTGSSARITLAVCAALLFGKPVGVIGASWLALATRLSVLPRDLDYRHLLVLGVVAGIGFTMSLFIAQLAFSDLALLSAAKLGVLAASAIAMLVGLALGRALLPQARAEP